MDSLDSSWLKFWETVGEWGFVFVIIGVAGEGVEIFIKLLHPKLYERKKFCLDIIGALFWIVLVVALAVEFWGNHKAMRIADTVNAQLDAEAGQARKDAGQANERAALTESNNLVLQKELEPRTITMKQMTNFIFLTEKISKIPIAVRAAKSGDDSLNYAYQIRAMLNAARFPPPTNAGVWGLVMDNNNPMIGRPIGINEEWPAVFYAGFGTNNFKNFTVSSFEITNGFFRPIVSTSSTENVMDGLYYCFMQIGIKIHWIPASSWMNVGEYEFYIPPKKN